MPPKLLRGDHRSPRNHRTAPQLLPVGHPFPVHVGLGHITTDLLASEVLDYVVQQVVTPLPFWVKQRVGNDGIHYPIGQLSQEVPTTDPPANGEKGENEINGIVDVFPHTNHFLK